MSQKYYEVAKGRLLTKLAMRGNTVVDAVIKRLDSLPGRKRPEAAVEIGERLLRPRTGRAGRTRANYLASRGPEHLANEARWGHWTDDFRLSSSLARRDHRQDLVDADTSEFRRELLKALLGRQS